MPGSPRVRSSAGAAASSVVKGLTGSGNAPAAAAAASRAVAAMANPHGLFGLHTRAAQAAARGATAAAAPRSHRRALESAGLGDTDVFLGPDVKLKSFINTVELGRRNIETNELRAIADKMANAKLRYSFGGGLYKLADALDNHQSRIAIVECCMQDILHAINPDEYSESDDNRWVARAPDVLELFRPALDAIGMKCFGTIREGHSFIHYGVRVYTSRVSFDNVPENLVASEDYNAFLKDFIGRVQEAVEPRHSLRCE